MIKEGFKIKGQKTFKKAFLSKYLESFALIHVPLKKGYYKKWRDLCAKKE